MCFILSTFTFTFIVAEIQPDCSERKEEAAHVLQMFHLSLHPSIFLTSITGGSAGVYPRYTHGAKAGILLWPGHRSIKHTHHS